METPCVMHRQGDVLLVKVEGLPSDLVERKSDVLVEGEETSHARRLTAGQIWQTRQGLLYLRAVAGSKIVHEEHTPLELEPGYWQVIRACFGMRGGNAAWPKEQDPRSFLRRFDGRMSYMQ